MEDIILFVAFMIFVNALSIYRFVTSGIWGTNLKLGVLCLNIVIVVAMTLNLLGYEVMSNEYFLLFVVLITIVYGVISYRNDKSD